MHAGTGWRQALLVFSTHSTQKMAPLAAWLDALPAQTQMGPALFSSIHGAGMGMSRSFLAESMSWLRTPHGPSLAAAGSPSRVVAAASTPPPLQLSRSYSGKLLLEREPAKQHNVPEVYRIPAHLRQLHPSYNTEPLPPLVLQASGKGLTQIAARKDQGVAAGLNAHSTPGPQNGAEAASKGPQNGMASRMEVAPSERLSEAKQALPPMAPLTRKRGPRKPKAVQATPASAEAGVTTRDGDTGVAKSTQVPSELENGKRAPRQSRAVQKQGSPELAEAGARAPNITAAGENGAVIVDSGSGVQKGKKQVVQEQSADAKSTPAHKTATSAENGMAVLDGGSSGVQKLRKRKPKGLRFCAEQEGSSISEGRAEAEIGQAIEGLESTEVEATSAGLGATVELPVAASRGQAMPGVSTPLPSATSPSNSAEPVSFRAAPLPGTPPPTRQAARPPPVTPSVQSEFLTKAAEAVVAGTHREGGAGPLVRTPPGRHAAKLPQATRSAGTAPVQAEALAGTVGESEDVVTSIWASEVSAETAWGSEVLEESAGETNVLVDTEEGNGVSAENVVAAANGDSVLVVNTFDAAMRIAKLAQTVHRKRVFACDTEVMSIDVKKESPVGHGQMTCFTWYAGPDVDWGGGCTQVFVDLLQGGEQLLEPFKSFFEDASIKKVWHNYGFDRHILFNHGVNARGLYADTMHMARLYDSARDKKAGAGYSLESLTADAAIMGARARAAGKIGMATLFGRPNIKKDGQEGKLKVLPPIEQLQTEAETRDAFIQYAALDAKATWQLWSALQHKLKDTKWRGVGPDMQGDLWTCYERYYAPFGELLTDMERAGMRVDTEHLAAMEKVALQEQARAVERFRRWASKRCPDAALMNVGSDLQIRQLLFGGTKNFKDQDQELPTSRAFKVPNTDGFVEPGREGKPPRKQRDITLCALIDPPLPVEIWTPSGWPAVSGAVLRSLAGKVAIDWAVPEADEDAEGSFEPADSDSEDAVKPPEDDESKYGAAYAAFGGGVAGRAACHAIAALCEVSAISTLLSGFIRPLQGDQMLTPDSRVHCSLNINTETGRLSARKPNLQNQPALEKDRYKIRKAFVAAPGKTLIVADYGQLELRLLAHLAGCESMLQAFEAGGDFHSRTAVNMYGHVRDAVERGEVLLEWEGARASAPAPMLKDVYGSERRKAKMLNFSIAYGKTAAGLSKDWGVSLEEAQATVDLWYAARQEVKVWQEAQREEARKTGYVRTLLGRRRRLPDINADSRGKKSLAERSAIYRRKSHAERAAINTPVQGSAADVAMLAMLELSRDARLAELGWTLLLQVHDEMILEGPEESAEEALQRVVHAMSHPFNGENILSVELAVDAKCADNWYDAK